MLSPGLSRMLTIGQIGAHYERATIWPIPIITLQKKYRTNGNP